jgi:hypothetical protein
MRTGWAPCSCELVHDAEGTLAVPETLHAWLARPTQCRARMTVGIVCLPFDVVAVALMPVW